MPLLRSDAREDLTPIRPASLTSRTGVDSLGTACVPSQDLSERAQRVHRAVMRGEQQSTDMEEKEWQQANKMKKSSGLNTILENETLPDEQYVDLSAMVPATILMAKTIGGIESDTPLRALLDTGACRTQLHSRVLTANMRPLRKAERTMTTMGTRDYTDVIVMEDLVLPEFSRTRHITKPLEVAIFDALSRYDIIVSRDLLSLLQIKLDFATGTSTWADNSVAWRDRDMFLTSEAALIAVINMFTDDDAVGDNYMLEAKYDKVDTDELCSCISPNRSAPSSRVYFEAMLSFSPES